jgi:hypothetical protein
MGLDGIEQNINVIVHGGLMACETIGFGDVCTVGCESLLVYGYTSSINKPINYFQPNCEWFGYLTAYHVQ